MGYQRRVHGESFPASCPVRYQFLQSSCQDERSAATGSSAWQRLCSPTGRIPLWHRERFQQFLWRERPRRTTATTSSSTTSTPASKVPAATIPTSAAVPTATTTAVPAPAPAAVPAATTVPAPTSPPACSIVQPTTNSCPGSSKVGGRHQPLWSRSPQPFLDRPQGQHPARLRGHLEDRLLLVPAARGQGVLRVDGHGAGVLGHSRQAGQLQQADRSRCSEVFLDRRRGGPRKRDCVLEQQERKANPVQRERSLVSHRRSGLAPAGQPCCRREPSPS